SPPPPRNAIEKSRKQRQNLRQPPQPKSQQPWPSSSPVVFAGTFITRANSCAARARTGENGTAREVRIFHSTFFPNHANRQQNLHEDFVPSRGRFFRWHDGGAGRVAGCGEQAGRAAPGSRAVCEGDRGVQHG